MLKCVSPIVLICGRIIPVTALRVAPITVRDRAFRLFPMG